MKLMHKMILGFLAVAVLIFITGNLAVNISERALKDTFIHSVESLSLNSLKDLNKSIYNKIELFHEYSHDILLQETIKKSNMNFEASGNVSDYMMQYEMKLHSDFAESNRMYDLSGNDVTRQLKAKTGFYKEYYDRNIITAVWVTNKYGVVIAGTRKTADYRMNDKKWWRTAKTNGLFVKVVEHPEEDDNFYVDIGLRVDDEQGNFIGVLKVNLNVDEMIEIIRSIRKTDVHKKHESMYVALFTGGGEPVYSSGNEECGFSGIVKSLLWGQADVSQFAGHDGVGTFDKTVQINNKPVDLLITYAGLKSYYNFHNFRGLDLILAIGHEKNEVFEPVIKLREHILKISLAVTMVGVLIGFFVSRSIVKKFKTLMKAMERIGRGELDVEIDIKSKDETGQLALRFTEMLKNLKESTVARDRLLKEVAERREAVEKLRLKNEEQSMLFKQVEIINKERQKIMDAVDDMIVLADKEGLIRNCNRAFSDFINKPYKDIIGLKWETLVYGNDTEARALDSGSIEILYLKYQKYFLLRTYPVEDIGPDFSGAVITMHETTGIKKVTEELKSTNARINGNREKLQNALNEISELIKKVIKQKDHSVRFINPHLKKCYEILKCENHSCPCKGKEAARCWQTAGTYCLKDVTGDFAKRLEVCSECSVFREATSDPIYKIGEHFNNMMHILDRKNQQLEKAYRELADSHTKILQQEKMASIGQLAAGVAHEINNPIGFISSNLGTLGKYLEKLTEFINVQAEAVESFKPEEMLGQLKELRKKLKLDYILEDSEELIKESLDGAERVKNIVQNLKSFSRVDEAEYQYADINKCIENTLNIVWNELKYKAIVEKEYGDMPMIKCYPQQLNQVIMNLLVNAAQAIEKQGIIKIRTWKGDENVFVSISDTGQGMPEEIVNRIFEPFFTTKEVGKGTGLGLSISYDIVKKHNGEISVESIINKGTEFKITIPVMEET